MEQGSDNGNKTTEYFLEEEREGGEREGGCGAYWMDLEGQVKVAALALLCSPAGAKRNAPSGPSASSAHSAVTVTTGASAHLPLAPANVSLATKVHAARSGCALRAGTA